MIVKLLTENTLEFLSLKGGCTGSSEPTLVKMPHVRNHMSRLLSQQVLCATSKASDQPAHTRSLIRAFASRLSIL